MNRSDVMKEVREHLLKSGHDEDSVNAFFVYDDVLKHISECNLSTQSVVYVFSQALNTVAITLEIDNTEDLMNFWQDVVQSAVANFGALNNMYRELQGKPPMTMETPSMMSPEEGNA